MKLTSQQEELVLKKLKDFFNRSCECNGHDWIINDKVFELREFNGGSLTIGSQQSVFPVITISCKNCGNTYFFNAILLGIINKNEQSKPN